MHDDKLTVILGQLETLQKAVDRISRDMDNDRKDLQDTQIRLGALETRVTQLMDTVEQMPTKVKDKVKDVVQPITDTLSEVKKERFWTKFLKRR